MSKVLGVYTGHDPAACLLVDGELRVLIEEERLTRFKHGLPQDVRGLWGRFNGRFGYFPWASVSYCLDAAGLGIDELDAVVLSEEARGCAMGELIPIKDRRKVLVSDVPLGGAHHYRHALSAFLASGFEEAAVLVVDGDGTVDSGGYEAESGYLFSGRDGRFSDVFKNRYPLGGALRSGLGWAYEYVSALLGFVETRIGYLGQPGKTMGLAPYGRPSIEGEWISRDGFKLDFAPFHRWLVETGHVKRLRFDSRERALIQSERAIPADAEDIAWKVQDELERALLHLVERLHAETGAEDLCLAGGVHLNSVANGRIVREGPFKRVFVQPAATDMGQALGLAYWGHLELAARAAAADAASPRVPVAPMRHAYGGRSYPLRALKRPLKEARLAFKELKSDAALAADAAGELAAGRFVGWFQGGSELGPRALGHRSILADPRGPSVKDVLNARVKFREPFRPFAPSVLAERAGEVFGLEGESPYMLLVVPVREAWRAQLPAITHVDGTARVQTVDAAVEPLYHALIAAFAERTGAPLLLNTSFNLQGMPIVETPRDALQCLLYTELDLLYLGPLKVERPPLRRLRPRARPEWRLAIENRLGWSGQTVVARYEREDGRGAPVELGEDLEQITLCGLLDGVLTLEEAVRQLADDAQPDAATLAAHEAFVRLLLRRGVLELAVGDLVL